MKAMVLAAGLGTRLRPLTKDRPKALVEVAGHTLLEITLRRLAFFGIREVIVNVHHFADLVVEYLRKNDNFGMRIEISREDVLLDTGGGLEKAGWFFADSKEPFVLHNVDVISTIDLDRMVKFHCANGGFATLAVQKRETSRYLLFDEKNELCGRQARGEPAQISRCAANTDARAFSGIHIISPGLIGSMTESGAFSIIDVYLRLASAGKQILGFPADEYYWRDVGKPANVAEAAHDVEQGVIQVVGP